MLLSPCWRNSNGEPTRFPILFGNDRTRGRFSGASGLPVSRVKSGLGSKVSRCEGPPNMKSMMIRLTFGGEMRRLGASGLTAAAPAVASSASNAESASPPNPAPIRSRKRRRETG